MYSSLKCQWCFRLAVCIRLFVRFPNRCTFAIALRTKYQNRKMWGKENGDDKSDCLNQGLFLSGRARPAVVPNDSSTSQPQSHSSLMFRGHFMWRWSCFLKKWSVIHLCILLFPVLLSVFGLLVLWCRKSQRLLGQCEAERAGDTIQLWMTLGEICSGLRSALRS